MVIADKPRDIKGKLGQNEADNKNQQRIMTVIAC